MSSLWPERPFSEVFRRVDRRFEITDYEDYDCVGVRWYGNGAFVRETKSGADIKRKEQWLVQSGDIVYNKLFAWKGSFAVASDDVDGCIISDKFPTYVCDDTEIDRDFIRWFFKTSQIATRAEELSKGAAAISKLTLNPPDFWKLSIPMPSLTEQRRIVAKLDRLSAKIETLHRLLDSSIELTSAWLGASLNEIASGFEQLGPLKNWLRGKPRNGWSARCDNAPDGVPVLALSAITGFEYQQTAFKRTSEATDAGAHYWLQSGDLLITRSNTPELVGHAAIYNGSPTPCIYPDLVMRIPLDTRRADVRFTWYWLQTPIVRDFITMRATGTSPTMRKISQGTVEQIPFPVDLSIERQRELACQLDQKLAKLREIKTKRGAVLREGNALMPSILDRAFRGEL